MTPFIVKSLCHPFVHLVGTEDVDQVVLVLVGQTSFITTLVGSLPTFGDKLCTARPWWSDATAELTTPVRHEDDEEEGMKKRQSEGNRRREIHPTSHFLVFSSHMKPLI